MASSQSLTRLLSKHKSTTNSLRRLFSTTTGATAGANHSSTIPRPLLRRVAAVSFPELRRVSPLYRGLCTAAEASAKPDEKEKKEGGEKEEKKEEIVLDGCDFKHWLVIMNKPEGDPTREEIIDGYVKTLANVLGSEEEEARQKIYSVSTRCYYAFGFLGEKEQTEKLHEVENVRFVVPDSYLDAKTKDYGGEPFINGQAVPYDPKYHKDWLRNNSGDSGRPRNNRKDFRSSGKA